MAPRNPDSSPDVGSSSADGGSEGDEEGHVHRGAVLVAHTRAAVLAHSDPHNVLLQDICAAVEASMELEEGSLADLDTFQGVVESLVAAAKAGTLKPG